MTKNFPVYWLTQFIVKDFIVPSNTLKLFDDKHTLKDIQNRPTIFLANHTSSLDPIHIHLTIQDNLSSMPRDGRRVIRSVSKDDAYLGNGGTSGKIKNYIANRIAEWNGSILVKRTDSINKTPRAASLFSMSNTLKDGQHILIYPMAAFSLDGRVDSMRNEDHHTFGASTMRLLARGAPDSYVQTIHYTIDPVYDKKLIRMGDLHKITQTRDYDFTSEISKCTSITTLQLFSKYKQMNEQLGLNISEEKMAKDLNMLVDLLTDKQYAVFAPSDDVYSDIIKHFENCNNGSKKPYMIKIDRKMRIDNQEYQANQIKHLNLDSTIEDVMQS